jgi:hypothetical protein
MPVLVQYIPWAGTIDLITLHTGRRAFRRDFIGRDSMQQMASEGHHEKLYDEDDNPP